MSTPISQRVLALAGLVQALAQVRRIADTGQADAAILATALDSVFRIDADSVEEVYGDPAALQPGLELLRGYFADGAKDPLLPKLALAVMQVERRFSADEDLGHRVQQGLLAAAAPAQRLGNSHPEVLAALGSLYADTISHLRPRVLVQGNPHYLGQANVVAEIRAVLLAAVRSAVLWRQLDGSLWDFVLRRREMSDAIAEQLA